MCRYELSLGIAEELYTVTNGTIFLWSESFWFGLKKCSKRSFQISCQNVSKNITHIWNLFWKLNWPRCAKCLHYLFPFSYIIQWLFYIDFIFVANPNQGCKIAYFLTKNPNSGKFWRVLQWKMLVYFIAIKSILWLFGIVCGHLV
jgi:hypothetical protein